MQQIRESEVNEMKNACDHFQHSIKFIFATVSRKTNVELYSQGFYEDSFKNIIPGTVLDNGITATKTHSINN